MDTPTPATKPSFATSPRAKLHLSTTIESSAIEEEAKKEVSSTNLSSEEHIMSLIVTDLVKNHREVEKPYFIKKGEVINSNYACCNN